MFSTAVNAHFYYDMLTPGSTAWSGWTGKGGSATRAPAVVQDHSGTIRAYARGTDGNLYELYSQPTWTIDDKGGALY